MSETFVYISLLLSMSPGVVYLVRAKTRTEATWGMAALLAFLPPIISAIIDQLFVAYLVAGLFIAAQFNAPILRWLYSRFGVSRGLVSAVLKETNARYHDRRDNDPPHELLITEALTKIAQSNRRTLYNDQVKPLADCMLAFAEAVPKCESKSPFFFPVIDAMDVARTVNKMLLAFNPLEVNRALFPELCRTLQQNWTLYAQKQLPPSRFEKGERIFPQDFKGEPKQLVYTYLKNTPLFDLFQAKVPWPMPDMARFEHQWVVGLPGSGKTQLLQTQLLADLQKVADGEASLVIIDSQGMSEGRLLSNVAKLDVFAPGGSLHDRLVIMEPSDEHPPALSLFDVGQYSPDLSPDERKRLAITAIGNIAFAISDTSEPMQDMLEYVVQLAMQVPDADIRTLRDILQSKRKQLFEDYADALNSVDPDVRNYFDHSFFSQGTDTTKGALVRRVAGMLRNPYFRAMYLSPRSMFHMAQELEAGKVILINADKGTLGTEYAVTFGRYFIAQLGSFMQRNRRSSKAILCYIDECHEFIGEDPRIEEILVQARKQRIGLVLAHQFMRQIKSDSLLSAVTGCRLKFAGANEDAVALARYFRTDADNLDRLKNLTFAAFDRSGTLPMVDITVVPGLMEKQPRMTHSQYQVMRDEIRKRYSTGKPTGPSAEPQPTSPQKRLTDGISDIEYEEVDRKWGDDVV